MKTISLPGCAALALICVGLAQSSPSEAQSGAAGRDSKIEPDFPQVRASPGLHQSGNECAPDRAEAAWGRNNRFLGYICVRNPSLR
jgi:hypothetical protein